MSEDHKSYWVDEEKFTGIPGADIHSSVAQFFADYYGSKKRHKVTLQVNDVTVTLTRKGV